MKIIAKNTRASYDYDIKQTFDAGLVLEGREVKSAKTGNISLNGSYVTVSGSGVKLVNCHIGPYTYAPAKDYDPTQSRTVLLTMAEIKQLLGKEKGLVLVPLEVYIGKRGLIKLRIGLGKTRKKTDKREYIKKRDIQKDIRRATDS